MAEKVRSPPTVQTKLQMENLIDRISKDPMLQQYAMAGVVGLVLLVLLIFFVTRRKLSSSRKSILIMGPSDVGKTAIFSQLVHGRSVDTYTSMNENSKLKSFSKTDDDSGNSRTVNVVDLPGFDRLRVTGLEKNKHNARGIIYVIDASSVAKTIADSTEYLFKILTDPVIHGNSVPVMIACNKSDLDLAKSSTIVERELEKEINLLRQTHARNMLQSTDGSVATNQVTLGKTGKDFKFAQLPNKVNFCEVSARCDDNGATSGFDQLKKWIYSVA